MTEMAEVRESWPVATTLSHDSADDVIGVLDAAVARSREVGADVVAEKELRHAVSAARDAGVPWGVIGDRLGMARGNAYQRYRKRPT